MSRDVCRVALLGCLVLFCSAMLSKLLAAHNNPQNVVVISW